MDLGWSKRARAGKFSRDHADASEAVFARILRIVAARKAPTSPAAVFQQ